MTNPLIKSHFSQPIGATADGKAVKASEPFNRLIDGLIRRGGGANAQTNAELGAEVDKLKNAVVFSRDELAAVDPAMRTACQLVEGLRSGVFVWSSADSTSLIAADPWQAMTIASTVVAAVSGAWVRVRANGETQAGWWGMSEAEDFDNSVPINAAIAFVQTTAKRITGVGPVCHASLDLPKSGYYYLYDSVNLTWCDPMMIRGNGCVLESRVLDSIAIDAGGAEELRVYNLTVYCSEDPAYLPKIGLKLGRVDVIGDTYVPDEYKRHPAPGHYFESCTFAGAASRAMFHNNGSEFDSFFFCEFNNAYANALDSSDPLTFTACVALDNYNDMDLGLVSRYAPVTTPPGTRGGTHHHNTFHGCRFRAPGPNVVPLYVNGPRSLHIEKGFILSRAKYGCIIGDGGIKPHGGLEQKSFDNIFQLHSEGANIDEGEDEPLYCIFAFRAVNRDITVTKMVHRDLQIHSNYSIYTVIGSHNVILDNVEFEHKSIIGKNGECYFFPPETKSQVSGTGKLAITPIEDVLSSLDVTTTAGSSLVTVKIKAHRLPSGDSIIIENDTTGGALSAVDGIVLHGIYTVYAVVDEDNIIVDSGQFPIVGGITANAVSGADQARIVNARVLDFSAGFSRFDGEIDAGAYHEYVRLPAGNVELCGTGLDARTFKGTWRRLGDSESEGYPDEILRQAIDTLPAANSRTYAPLIGMKWAVSPSGVTVAAGAIGHIDISSGVDGILPTDKVDAIANLGAAFADVEWWARCLSANICRITFKNHGASSSTIPTADWVIQAQRPTETIIDHAPAVNVTPPSISGTAKVGFALQALDGVWNPPQTSYVRQWYRDVGAGLVPIPGASGRLYTCTADDIGATMYVSSAPPYTVPVLSAGYGPVVA